MSLLPSGLALSLSKSSLRLGQPLPLWRRLAHATISGSSFSDPTLTTNPTFRDLGVREPIVEALHRAFPNVEHPTDAQSDFIPAILAGKDVMLKDGTGTGKSFGLMLALLSKPRIAKPDRARVDAGEKPAINSVIVVPHRDLAYQLSHWAKRITDAMVPKSSLASISCVTRVLVRGSDLPLEEQIKALRNDPPHILIGTPQALLDVLKDDADALQLDRLSTVVVDEIDYLIEAVPQDEYRKAKMKKMLDRHPNQTKLLLEKLFTGRPKPKYIEEKADVRKMSGRMRRELRPPVQLIVSSATLRGSLKGFLQSRNGWLAGDSDRFANVATATSKVIASGEATVGHRLDGLGGIGIEHSVLLVSEDGVKNIEDVATTGSSDENTVRGERYSSVDEYNVPAIHTAASKKVPPFSLAVTEAVATAFALDVPRLALLVVPATAPVHSVVAALRDMGVNAHGLNLLADDNGRAHLSGRPSDEPVEDPKLLVSTIASTRGLDLPELSHVFLMGMPAKHRSEHYVHIAGRVGRFQRGGKVITLLEPQRDRGVVKMMKGILKEIGVIPTKFEHFE